MYYIAIMENMTDEFRKQVKMHIAFNENINQTQLAEKLCVSRQYLNRVLNGSGGSGKMPDIWQGILEEVGMTIVAVPLNKLSDVKKAMAG